MSQVHLAASLVTTTNATSYTTPSFTPEAGDLIFVVATLADVGNPNNLTVSDSVDGAYYGGWFNPTYDTRYDPFRWHGAWGYVCPSAPTATARTVTVAITSPTATGCTIHVLLIKNATAYGANACRQNTYKFTYSNSDSSTTPTVTFASAPLSSSVIVGVVASRTPAPLSAPTGFTQQANAAHADPDNGVEICAALGSTGTTLTWGGSTIRYVVMAWEFKNTGVPHQDPVVVPDIDAITLNSYEIKVLTGR
jgi:hypothetical protein